MTSYHQSLYILYLFSFCRRLFTWMNVHQSLLPYEVHLHYRQLDTIFLLGQMYSGRYPKHEAKILTSLLMLLLLYISRKILMKCSHKQPNQIRLSYIEKMIRTLSDFLFLTNRR